MSRAERPAWTVAACALLAASWAATLALYPWSDESVGDLGSRSGVAEIVLGGALPYRDFAFEYPPLAAPVMTLPGLAGTEEPAYRVGIAIVTLGLAVVVLLLCRALAIRTGGDPRGAMLGVAVAPLLLGSLIRLHVDLAPVALAVGALLALVAGRTGIGFVLVGLGAMTKAFPLVLAPVALAWLVARGERRAATRGAVALAATIGVLAVLWVALSPEGALDAVRFQLERPLQLESSPSSFLFGLGTLGFGEPEVVESHRSAGLLHPASGAVGAAFSAALLVIVGLLGALAAAGQDRRSLALASLTALVAFAALGRVLSPQFLIWAVPLLALALAWRMYALAVLTALACVLTLAEFPSRYLDLTDAEPGVVALVAARNALLLGVVGLASLTLARAARSLRAPSAPARWSWLARPAPQSRTPR